jgi:hypothetical protein
MTTVHVTIRVTDGKIEIETPTHVALADGRHAAVIAIDDALIVPPARSLFDVLVPIRVSGWSADSTFSREDLYNDDGR